MSTIKRFQRLRPQNLSHFAVSSPGSSLDNAVISKSYGKSTRLRRGFLDASARPAMASNIAAQGVRPLLNPNDDPIRFPSLSGRPQRRRASIRRQFQATTEFEFPEEIAGFFVVRPDADHPDADHSQRRRSAATVRRDRRPSRIHHQGHEELQSRLRVLRVLGGEEFRQIDGFVQRNSDDRRGADHRQRGSPFSS